MAVVTFDIAKFRSIYPEFANQPDARLEFFFGLATQYVNNTDCSIVTDVTERERLLFLLVAHIAMLNPYSASQNNASGLVGRISKASEGSVSVEADMPDMGQSSAWYMQSKYGSMFWAMTVKYRSFRYSPGYSPSNYPNYYSPRFYR